MNKKHIAGYVVVTIVAFAVGTAASGGENTTEVVAAPPEPAPTVTVPAPAVTVTQPPVVETVEVTPQACLDSLQYASQISYEAAEFANITGRILPLIDQALTAGINYDAAAVADITAELDSVNDDLDSLLAGMPDEAAVAEAAEACRNGAVTH